MTRVSNEAGFTVVRDGYDPVEVDERLVDLQTQLAGAEKRSAALERVLRATVAEATELLHRLDSETRVATGRERRLDQRRQSRQPDRVESSEPTDTRDAVAVAPPVALHTAQPPPDHTASAMSQARGVAEPTTSPERQWIRGTIREISRTEAGATIWVVPEDSPQSVVSILFTNEEVGPEAVAYLCATFEAGESVRVSHTDRHGHNIEQI